VFTEIISLHSVNQLIFVMVKCGVFFAVRTEFLNIIWTSFGFKGLCVSFFCVKFVHSHFCSDKYLASYARLVQTRVGLHVVSVTFFNCNQNFTVSTNFSETLEDKIL
jgi:hypothetical protein